MVSTAWLRRQSCNGCRSLLGASLLVLYADAVLRVIQGLLGDGFGPLIGVVVANRHSRAAAANASSPPHSPRATGPPSTSSPRLREEDLAHPESMDSHDRSDHLLAPRDAAHSCTRHELLLGNLYADLAPWVDHGLRVTEHEMGRLVEYVAEHRGKWDSWVTDTLTPVLIKGGKVYLTLGPPTKDPTNYFWSVLMDLQELARKHKLPDVELLLNFADTPVVKATSQGTPSLPVPVFSYCKQEGYLDILVPGYYSPDRVCEQYRRQYNNVHKWERKANKAFARFTHFCKFTRQQDVYQRTLPPCSRSFFASISDQSSGRLDIAPLNTVNDTNDPSLRFGRTLLKNSSKLPLSEHGRYKYLLDTDGFTSAYKLQQLLAVNSVVLHHQSIWRAYYYDALHAFVHYVPLWKSSSTDVFSLIDWLRGHDAVARRIAINGQHFACNHLTKQGRLCYWLHAIREYAGFMDYTPTLRARSFPLDRINFMCRIHDGPNTCYYNIKPGPLPDGYECRLPVPNWPGVSQGSQAQVCGGRGVSCDDTNVWHILVRFTLAGSTCKGMPLVAMHDRELT